MPGEEQRQPDEARVVESPPGNGARGKDDHQRLRDAANGRGQQLLTITAAIADAVSSDQVFEALVDRLGEAVGASSVGLWLVEEGSSTARLARTNGYEAGAAQRLERLILDQAPSVPVQDAIRGGEPVWIASRAALLERYPHLVSLSTDGRAYRVSCLPLFAEGRIVGAIGLTIEEELVASDEERDFLLVVARHAGQALERLRLFEETVAARSRAEELYRFAQAVVAADDLEKVFDAALRGAEGALGGSRAAILTFDEEDVLRFRAWHRLSDAYRAGVEGHSPWPRTAISPEPVLVPDVLSDPSLAAHVPLLRAEGIGGLAFIPLVASGRLLGKMMVYYDRRHSFSAQEVETAQALATHLASVITRFTALQTLEETVRYNELFAGVLAHDLRNPLSAVMTSAQTLVRRREAQGSPPGKDEKTLRLILASGRRMARMIDQLLDFTKARSGGGIDVAPRPNNLADLCAQAVAEIELAHPDWNIHSEAVGDQTGTWDAERLLQLISNLVANAGQHGAAGGGIRVVLDGRDADDVRFEIHNEGVIPPAILTTVFDPFRTTRQPRAPSRGLGLGLFIVREIARAHGGVVDVSSSDGEGTTFSIRLPRHRAPSVQPDERPTMLDSER